MKYSHLIYLLLFVAFNSCKKDNKPPVTPTVITQDTAVFTSVIITADKNPGKITTDITCQITDDEITAFLPSIQNNRKLVITYATKTPGTVVKANNTEVGSGTTITDFSKPVTFTITTPKGLVKNYKFSVKNFTGIPILYLNTSGPIVSKDDYVDGTLTINPNNEYEQEKTTIDLKAKGRGNSTWPLPKKPYRLKFDSKAEMLGMPAAKNWVLLANYADRTLFRTSLAFDLGRKIGADFTPPTRFVELVLNGQHLGNYVLTTQVEIHENRVNIAELKSSDTSPDKITGGYLLEIDFRLDAPLWFRTAKNLPFTLKDPDELTTAQFEYIKGYIQQTEDAIFAENFADPVNGYAKFINVESFINWYLVEELGLNIDSQDQTSVFYYKDRNGKLGMGPLWDFDISFGNTWLPGNIWYTKGGLWFKRLFKDPAFLEKVRARWASIKVKEVAEMYKKMDDMSGYINLSQQKNFQVWPILNPDALQLKSHGDYNGEVAYAKEWLTNRIAWLDANLAAL